MSLYAVLLIMTILLDKQINHGNEEKAKKILLIIYKLVEQICRYFF